MRLLPDYISPKLVLQRNGNRFTIRREEGDEARLVRLIHEGWRVWGDRHYAFIEYPETKPQRGAT